jgi:hypothetical protein
MSDSSPLSAAQKEKDKAEAHADPSMVHMKKKSAFAQAVARKARSGARD